MRDSRCVAQLLQEYLQDTDREHFVVFFLAPVSASALAVTASSVVLVVVLAADLKLGGYDDAAPDDGLDPEPISVVERERCVVELGTRGQEYRHVDARRERHREFDRRARSEWQCHAGSQQAPSE